MLTVEIVPMIIHRRRDPARIPQRNGRLGNIEFQAIVEESGVMESRITVDPAVCHGKPCIRGMRYPVESILEWLAAGMTIDEILDDYEDLEREDILAALAFAARMTHVKRADTDAA